MLKTYRLDRPEIAESTFLDGWSYRWASLFGPLYVLIKGFAGSSLLMLGASASIDLLAFSGLGVTLLLSTSIVAKVVALVGLPIAALLIQGIAGIRIVRAGYASRGWREGY